MSEAMTIRPRTTLGGTVGRRMRGWLCGAVMAGFLAGCGYNDIQRTDEATGQAWAEVVNQYQRRSDLIPNLVRTVQAYADQEKDVLTRVTEARSRVGQMQVNPSNEGSVKQFEQAQGEMTSALSRLLVVSENYPDLKSDQNFRELQAQLEGTENRIAVARKRYIDSVNQYNVLIRQVPVNLTAMVMGYKAKPQFTVENEREISRAPTVDFGNRQPAAGRAAPGSGGAAPAVGPDPASAGGSKGSPQRANSSTEGAQPAPAH